MYMCVCVCYVQHVMHTPRFVYRSFLFSRCPNSSKSKWKMRRKEKRREEKMRKEERPKRPSFSAESRAAACQLLCVAPNVTTCFVLSIFAAGLVILASRVTLAVGFVLSSLSPPLIHPVFYPLLRQCFPFVLGLALARGNTEAM